MENAGWTLEKCKEYEKEQIEKCFPETEMPGDDAAFDHSECRNPEELSKKIVRSDPLCDKVYMTHSTIRGLYCWSNHFG